MEHQLATKSTKKERSQGPASSSTLQQSSSNQATAHPLLRLQRAVGNQAVQNMMRSGEVDAQGRTHVGMRQPGISALVATPPQPVLQRKCACGGGQGSECGCAKSASTVSPTVYNALRSSGQPLPPGTRTLMETSFGQDFSQVRVHTKADADTAAQMLNARAFTVGQNIAFRTEEYAPTTREGQRLLAHELTHVIQQSSGSANPMIQSAPVADSVIYEPEGEAEREAELLSSQVVSGNSVRVHEQTLPQPARAENPKQISSYFDFQAMVFVRAIERLESNIQKLDEWRKYIDAQFDDVGLQAQIASVEATHLFQSARARGQEQSFAQWTSTRSPATRAELEGKMNGLINNGCQECHESNIVWNWNIRHEAEIRNLPTPAQTLALLDVYTELDRIVKGEKSTNVSGQATKPSKNIQTQSAPSTSSIQATPMMVQPPSQSTAPPNLQYPDVQIGLCGTLPEPDSKPEPAPFDVRLWGADTALALQSVQRIGLVLEPLGPAGYRILPGELFSTLYNRGPATLRTDVMHNIAVRQGKYRQLQNLIVMGKVSYTELCPIVEELFGSATLDVQLLVAGEITRAQISEWVLDKLMKIAGAALLLLSIIFPPSALLVAAGAGLAIAQIGTGWRDMLRGYQYDLGTGAGVFSPEQETSASGLYTGGILSIGSGVIGLGSSAFSGAQLAKQASWRNALMEALAAERVGPMASGKFNPLPDGSYVAFHPVNPNVTIVLEGDQLTCEVFVEGEWRVLATQRSPWGPGTPPPGTMTWERYVMRLNPSVGRTGTPGVPGKPPTEKVPPKPEPPMVKAERPRLAAEVQKYLKQEGLTTEEILGFSGGMQAQQLSRASAARVERLLKRFTPKDLKELGKYLWDEDIVLNEDDVSELIEKVRPGEMGARVLSARIAQEHGEATRRPVGFKDMPELSIKTMRRTAEDHHIATRYRKDKKNQAIFKSLGLTIDDDLNLIKEFPEHGQLRGWYEWKDRKWKFVMKGHHREYNDWVTGHIKPPDGLPPDQALSRIVKVLRKLNDIIQKYPYVLSYGPKSLPEELQHLTFD